MPSSNPIFFSNLQKIQGAKNMPISQQQIDNWFMYHAPKDGAQVAQYQRIREAGKVFAEVILRETPPSADQTDAIRKVREAVMTANAAVACDGK